MKSSQVEEARDILFKRLENGKYSNGMALRNLLVKKLGMSDKDASALLWYLISSTATLFVEPKGRIRLAKKEDNLGIW